MLRELSQMQIRIEKVMRFLAQEQTDNCKHMMLNPSCRSDAIWSEKKMNPIISKKTKTYNQNRLVNLQNLSANERIKFSQRERRLETTKTFCL